MTTSRTTAAAQAPKKKTTPTPRREPNRSATPGPKPEFQLIGDLLHYVGPKTGIEVIVDVDPPFSVLDDMLNDDDVADDERAQFQLMMSMLGNEDVLATCRQLKTSEFFTLVTRYIKEVQKFMGASLGELDGSEDNSEPTETL